MKSTKFSIFGENVDFDINGDVIASYDLMNWQREQDGSLRLLRVGWYDASLSPELSLVVNESAIQWPVGQQVCSLTAPSRPPLPLRLLCVILINALGNLLISVLHLLDILSAHLHRSTKRTFEDNNNDVFALNTMCSLLTGFFSCIFQ